MVKERGTTTWQVKRNKNIQLEDELGNSFKIRMNTHFVSEHHDIFNLSENKK